MKPRSGYQLIASTGHREDAQLRQGTLCSACVWPPFARWSSARAQGVPCLLALKDLSCERKPLANFGWACA